MTQEDKQLLLRDLCARLPYEVIKKKKKDIDTEHDLGHGNYKQAKFVGSVSNLSQTTISIFDEGLCEVGDTFIDNIKPYLRPMSSMTDEERLNMTKEIKGLKIQYFASSPWEWCVCGLVTPNTLIQVVDWLNAHHFDYRGLIEKGLAIEVTPENNPYK